MRFVSPDGKRALDLAYCLNLHGAESLDEVLAGIERVTAPLAARLAAGGSFGAGPYLAAAAVFELDDAGRAALRERLAAHRLDPFTFNAFPFGGFHRAGLKERVFAPTWADDERRRYTLAVAELACALGGGGGHVSISTHTGGLAEALDDDAREACARGFARCIEDLARIEEERDVRIVLALEPEPRSLANDTRELAALRERIAEHADYVLLRRHLGVCLDACHAAVEFEDPVEAFERATDFGPLGKIQFSSALRLPRPDGDAAARDALLAMDEPVYLHQVTGRRGTELVRSRDLPEVRRAVDANDPAWSDCDEWRCHFHVPVDLDRSAGIATTRADADAILRAALAAPERWGTDELHVEIETYTWDVLPGEARGTSDLVDGLEREYGHVLELLATEGWTRGESPSSR